MKGFSNPPCCNNGLDAGFELHDSYLRVLIERHHGHAQRVRQPGEAVGLVLVIERVQHLHWRHRMVRREGELRVEVLASH